MEVCLCIIEYKNSANLRFNRDFRHEIYAQMQSIFEESERTLENGALLTFTMTTPLSGQRFYFCKFSIILREISKNTQLILIRSARKNIFSIICFYQSFFIEFYSINRDFSEINYELFQMWKHNFHCSSGTIGHNVNHVLSNSALFKSTLKNR